MAGGQRERDIVGRWLDFMRRRVEASVRDDPFRAFLSLFSVHTALVLVSRGKGGVKLQGQDGRKKEKKAKRKGVRLALSYLW